MTPALLGFILTFHDLREGEKHEVHVYAQGISNGYWQRASVDLKYHRIYVN